ncbi:MAG TPA: cobalamin-binding protein [Terriglobales bacterium]|nr:cobalamin-binding protein [Terriglobales bacterium]
MVSSAPRRIVCLTEETTETLYLLEEGERVVGVSGYTRRPPQARRKPRVSAFTTANIEAIVALQPDLVLTFSDLQRDITRELVGRGLTVFNFNQRSVEEIFEMMGMLARLVGAGARGAVLEAELRAGLGAVASSAARFPHRPRVFFEEWPEPLISGIRWVEELTVFAGGTPIFPELLAASAARERIVDPALVAARDPEVILASWCGRQVKKETIRSRPGWDATAAVRNGHVYEITSTYILQPGPAALTEGVRQLHQLLCHVAGVDPAAAPAPEEKMDHELPSRSYHRT